MRVFKQFNCVLIKCHTQSDSQHRVETAAYPFKPVTARYSPFQLPHGAIKLCLAYIKATFAALTACVCVCARADAAQINETLYTPTYAYSDRAWQRRAQQLAMGARREVPSEKKV